MLHVYVTYNALTKTYEPPCFVPEDPKLYGKRLHDSIILDPEKTRSVHGDECQVYYLGEYDIEKGTILFVNPDQSGDLVIDAIQCFKQLEALKNAVAAN